MGRVFINDPIQETMLVIREENFEQWMNEVSMCDEAHMPILVSETPNELVRYDQLTNLEQPLKAEETSVDDSEDDEENQPKKVSAPKKERTTPKKKEAIDLLSLVPVMHYFRNTNF